jgi:hypothetical protein
LSCRVDSRGNRSRRRMGWRAMRNKDDNLYVIERII